MMPLPPDAPMSVRLGARLGPEIVASVLVVAIVAVGIGVALSARGGGGSAPTPPPPSPSGGAPSVSPSLPSPTAPSGPARALLPIVDRLLEQRGSLAAEVAGSRTDVAAIADLLRDVNTSLVLQQAPLAELAAESATADLAARLRAVRESTFNAVRRTQRASITNVRAYRTGASDVIAELAPLAAIRIELAAFAGETPAPAGGPAQPDASPASSNAAP